MAAATPSVMTVTAEALQTWRMDTGMSRVNGTPTEKQRQPNAAALVTAYAPRCIGLAVQCDTSVASPATIVGLLVATSQAIEGGGVFKNQIRGVSNRSSTEA